MLTRRNPLVILLCLELMLNAGNLALVAFARMHGNGDGQIFALIVMVVAACEVTIGLGMIVAIYRRRLPIDVDELRELHGMSATHLAAGWSSRSRCAGTLVIALGWRVCPARRAGWIGTARDRRAFVCAIGALVSLQGHEPEHRQVVSSLYDYAVTVGRRRAACRSSSTRCRSSWSSWSAASRR